MTQLLALAIVSPMVKTLCKQKYKFDINYPLKSGTFDPEFKFFDVKNPKIQKIEDNHFRMIENFGIVVDQGTTYKLTQADIFAPSLHTISGKQFALEMQIKGFDSSKGMSFTQVFLFEKASVPFVHLFKIGVGRGEIRKLARKREDFRNSYIQLHTTLNFSPYVDDVRAFMRYEGNDFNGKSKGKSCPKSKFNIMFETLWVSEEQLEEFKGGFPLEIGKQESKDVFANFEIYSREQDDGVQILLL